MNKPVLELSGIAKSFKQGKEVLQILQDVNLTISAGEMVALVGPSGSGKSTLLQIAGLLDHAESGEIRLEEDNLNFCSDQQRTKTRLHKIGFVYQFHHLLPEFTAIENIMLPLIIQGVDRRIAKKQASILLEQLQLDLRSAHFPSELSGGEQQRVAIARALIHQPKLLLADEPTGNLDAHSAAIVFDLLLHFARERELATLIVTHNLQLATKMDKIITLQDGKLVRVNG